MGTVPRCLVELEIVADGPRSVIVKIRTEQGPKAAVTVTFTDEIQGTKLSTHMLYEALEVQVGNALRPLINKLLSQIKENYPI